MESDLDMLMVGVTNDHSLLKKLLPGKFTKEELGEALIVAASQPQNLIILQKLIQAGSPVEYNKHAALKVAKKYDNKEYIDILSGDLYATFEDQVDAAAKDLLHYPAKEISLLAKKLGVKGHRQIAKKLLSIYSEELPSSLRNKCSRYSRKLSDDEIDTIRNTIYNEFKQYKDSVTDMTEKDLEVLFSRYDELCFGGDIRNHIKDVRYKLQFKTSGEETFTTEGTCNHKTCDYTITIPIEYFSNVNGITNVAGHPCKDQLECLLRVIEHEMIHLIIFIFCRDNFITDQHGPLFMDMANDLFRHSDHRHYIF